MQESIASQVQQALTELCDTAKLQAGDLLVIGCSSSEVIGQRIGTDSNVDVAKEIFDSAYALLQARGIYLAAQCCEHLNRALIVERAAAERFGLEAVNVIPHPKAGGSFATAAYHAFSAPTAVETLRQSARAGIDIGGTLIGMHIKPVVVPVRLQLQKIGNATLICARSRAKFVGGSRAHYDDNLL